MRRVDERQRDERSAVLGPRRQRRQSIEPDVGRHAIGDRSALDAPRADLEQLDADIPRLPELARRRRQQRLGQLDEPADQPQRPLAKRELGAASGAEQIGDEPEVGALDVGEEQRGTARRDHAPMNLGGFEMGIDLRFDRDEVIVTAKLVEKRAEIGERRNGLPTGYQQQATAGLAFRVGARAVDVRNLRAHRAQIRGQLAAVMDAVVVGEADELRLRHLIAPKKLDVSAQLVARQRAQCLSFSGNAFL